MTRYNDNGHKPNGPRPKPYIPPKAGARAKKPKKKRGPMFKFLVIFLSILTPIVVLAAAGYYVLSYMLDTNDLNPDEQQARAHIQGMLSRDGLISPDDLLSGLTGNVRQRTNFMILGIDWEGQTSRADTIMVGSFDTVSDELTIISIPRDTYISLSDATVNAISGLDRTHLPRHSRNGINNGNHNMRINAIYHHFGHVYGIDVTTYELGGLLGFWPDYYVCVQFDGFIAFIDAGG